MTDNPEHSAAYKLFHYPFECTIPTFYLYSQEYVSKFGIASSGNAQVDEQQARTPQRCRLTVAAMASYFDEGAPIGLIDARDSVRIYQYIRQHLLDWQSAMLVDFNRRDTPVEELRVLENFGAEIYKVARHFLTEAPEDSGLFQKLSGLSRRRGIKRHSSVEAPPPQVPEQHNPIVDALAVEHNKRNKRWL